MNTGPAVPWLVPWCLNLHGGGQTYTLRCRNGVVRCFAGGGTPVAWATQLDDFLTCLKKAI